MLDGLAVHRRPSPTRAWRSRAAAPGATSMYCVCGAVVLEHHGRTMLLHSCAAAPRHCRGTGAPRRAAVRRPPPPRRARPAAVEVAVGLASVAAAYNAAGCLAVPLPCVQEGVDGGRWCHRARPPPAAHPSTARRARQPSGCSVAPASAQLRRSCSRCRRGARTRDGQGVVVDDTGGAGHAAAAIFCWTTKSNSDPCVGLRLRGAPAPPYRGTSPV